MCSRFHHILSLLVVSAVASGLVFAADRPTIADKDIKSFVDQRVKEWQPTAEERRFDEIGWSTRLIDAEKLAKEHHRPIFLFTHDGKMNVGRC